MGPGNLWIPSHFAVGPSVCESLSSQIESFHFLVYADNRDDSHSDFFNSETGLVFDVVGGAEVLSSAI